jgi:hypothetical protein
MGFYNNLTSPLATDRFTVPDLKDLYVTTCALVTGGNCNYVDVEPGWRTIPGTTPPVSGVIDGAEQLVTNGAITPAQRALLLSLGDMFAVSEDTAP